MAPEGAAGSRRERISGVEVLHYRSLEMMESFNELPDYQPTLSSTNVRGRRLALATTALMSPPMHRRTALKASLLAFCKNDESLAAVRSYRWSCSFANAQATSSITDDPLAVGRGRVPLYILTIKHALCNNKKNLLYLHRST